MWIISKKYGAFNTDTLSAIQPPDSIDGWHGVRAYSSGWTFRITEGDDNYQKILRAIANHDSIVEVS